MNRTKEEVVLVESSYTGSKNRRKLQPEIPESGKRAAGLLDTDESTERRAECRGQQYQNNTRSTL